MPENVFLTGATGLLGNNLARELVARGYRVTAFVPFEESTRSLENHPMIDIRRGDLLANNEVLDQMKGCDCVIHAGANTTVSPAHHPLIYRVNVLGTHNVIEAALKLGVWKIVNIGSANIFGYGTLQAPGNETSPFNCGHFGLDYPCSKLQAYHEVQLAVKKRGLPAVTICPTFMLGPYDTKPSSGAMLVSLFKGKVPGYTSGGRNYVHVRDVAVGTVNALEFGRIGEAYILGHRNMDYKSAFELMLREMHLHRRMPAIPDVGVKIFGALSSAFAFLRRSNPTISYKMASIGCAGFYYSSEKAIRELQLPQTPIEIAIRDAMQWFGEHGYLPNPNNASSLNQVKDTHEIAGVSQ